MNRKIIAVLIMHLIISVFIGYNEVQSQEVISTKLNYISPKPGSKFIMPDNNIAIRHGEKFDPNSVKQSIFEVKTVKNEKIYGDVILSDDGKTLIFKPTKPFSFGNRIQVTLNNGLRTTGGIEIGFMQYYFDVIEKIVQLPEEYYVSKLQYQNLFPIQNNAIPKSTMIQKKNNNLPEGYPGIQVNVLNENASNGYYFFTPYDEWGWFPDTKPYLTITDINGIPVYYRKLQNVGYDLKIQPTGYLSFYSYHPFWKHMVMDSSYRIIDSFHMGNGYGYTDFHEFQLLENGHAFVMTYDAQSYAMDTVVPGGHPDAIVIGFVFQELDINKDVIFQWRSWDHFLITDAGPFVDLTDSIIDYVHGNSIEIESDNSLLISSRNMDEITRIDRNTGNIIWRLGGKKTQFEFINDTLGFSVQHDGRRLSNGNITLFDNGSLHPDPKYSSGLEYELDEINMTAKLINRLRSTPDILGVVMGNKQWRSENSKVVGWGSGVPGISEMDANGDVVYEMEFEGISYRAYLFPWKTNYFLFATDTLQYGYIWHESTLTKKLKVCNNSNKAIELTSYFSMNDAFTVENEFPVSLSPEQSVNLQVKFNPEETGEFGGMLTINSDINSDTLVQRIAQQVYLIGHATAGQGFDEFVGSTHVNIYPNPFFDVLNIKFGSIYNEALIIISNPQGKVIFKEKKTYSAIHHLDMQHLPSGVYFIQINLDGSDNPVFYKLIKS